MRLSKLIQSAGFVLSLALGSPASAAPLVDLTGYELGNLIHSENASIFGGRDFHDPDQVGVLLTLSVTRRSFTSFGLPNVADTGIIIEQPGNSSIARSTQVEADGDKIEAIFDPEWHIITFDEDVDITVTDPFLMVITPDGSGVPGFNVFENLALLIDTVIPPGNVSALVEIPAQFELFALNPVAVAPLPATEVPLPATAPLLLGAIAIFGVARRLRRSP